MKGEREQENVPLVQPCAYPHGPHGYYSDGAHDVESSAKERERERCIYDKLGEAWRGWVWVRKTQEIVRLIILV